MRPWQIFTNKDKWIQENSENEEKEEKATEKSVPNVTRKRRPNKLFLELPSQPLEDSREEEESREFQPLFTMKPEMYSAHS